MSDEAVCRTAPATLGLSKSYFPKYIGMPIISYTVELGTSVGDKINFSYCKLITFGRFMGGGGIEDTWFATKNCVQYIQTISPP